MLIEIQQPAPKTPLDKLAAGVALVKRTKRALTILVGTMKTTREGILADLSNNADGLTPDEALKAFTADDAAELADLLDTLGGIAQDKGLKVSPLPVSMLPAVDLASPMLTINPGA